MGDNRNSPDLVFNGFLGLLGEVSLEVAEDGLGDEGLESGLGHGGAVP